MSQLVLKKSLGFAVLLLLVFIGPLLVPLKVKTREREIPKTEQVFSSRQEANHLAGRSRPKNLSQEVFEFSENESGIVEIEPTYLIRKTTGFGYELAAYDKRRANWGTQVGIGYSLFRPKEYSADLVQGTFEEVYDGGPAGLVEIEILVKRNLGFGSLGGELAVGTYSVSSHPDFPDLSLSLTQIRVGVRAEIKTWSNEPYIVPYIAGGGYILVYKEEQSSSSFNGSTLVAPYFIAGVQFQLNWLDKESASHGFRDSGLENTYFYTEGRVYSASSEERDPNFKADFHPGAGLKLEF